MSVILNPNNIQPTRYGENVHGLLKKKSKRSRSGFRIPLKFKKIKVENRLLFLRSYLREQQEYVSLTEMVNKRRGFNYSKGYQFPLDSGIKCYLCGVAATIRHHVIPLSKGGRNTVKNIVPLCHKCHCQVHPHMHKGAKKNKPVFRITVKRNPVLCKPKQDIVVIPPKSNNIFENCEDFSDLCYQ